MYHYKCVNAISPAGLSQFSDEYTSVSELEEADVLLVRSAALHDMEFPEKLQAIARAGAGVNNIPLERCADQGIVVFNTPGANANSVKELVLAGLLLAARDIIGGVNWVSSERQNPEITKLAEKEKKQFAGHELRGKKLGVIGLGAIGALVANMAIDIGMDVYGYDPYLSIDGAWHLSSSVHHISDVNEIYRNCDFITIHVPLLDDTRKMINAQAIAQMKDHAVILNFARDLLVDEEAVLDALRTQKLSRYVSDFPNPVTAGARGVILIPHLGASTEEAEDNCAVMAVKELRNFMENGNIRNSVNYPNCDLGICRAQTRIAIYHKNVKKMLNHFTDQLSDYNITNMSNTSKGAYAYTLLDLDEKIPDEVLERLSQVEGTIRIRVVK